MNSANRRRVLRALLALLALVATLVCAIDHGRFAAEGPRPLRTRASCARVLSALRDPEVASTAAAPCDRACSLFTGVSFERGVPSGLTLLALKLVGKRLRRV